MVATIAAGSQPLSAGVSPDGARVYVTNINANIVSVINTATNTVVATIPVESNPTGVTVTPDGTRAYVTNAGSNTVSVINTATNTVVTTVPVGFLPQLVAVSPDGTRAYVTNGFADTVSVINTATNTVVATIPVGSQPTGVVFTPDGTRAYVTNNFLNNTVSVINTATNTVIATLPVGAVPQALGICSNGNALLAAGLTFKANTSGALNCTLASGPTGSPGPVFTGGTLQLLAPISRAACRSACSRGGHLRHQRQQCDTCGHDQRARRADQDRRRHANAVGKQHLYRRDVGQCWHAAEPAPSTRSRRSAHSRRERCHPRPGEL